ncbi:UNVERIFIED_ORG: hypothetical protein HNP28_000999 [Comamonas terrigena]
MTTIHKRKQYAVGQGFFHTGELCTDADVHLRYVVDCGATVDTFLELFNCIRRYLQTLSSEDQLDVLFITHAHFDHLSGVKSLLQTLKVETIVLPLIHVADRLYAYARALDAGDVGSLAGFYEEFIADPIATVAGLGPRRIILIESSDGGGAPFSREGDDGGRGPDGFGDDGRDLPYKTKIIGHGNARRSHTGSRVPVLIVPDSMALANNSAYHRWLLAPYVDSAIASQRTAFVTALATQLGFSSVQALEQKLEDPSYITTLLTVKTEREKLKAAYKSLTTDLNITSLCVYSGPARNTQQLQMVHYGKFGVWRVGPSVNNKKIAWLGTGDAALSDNTRYSAFKSHYGQLLPTVLTLALPHHGSAVGFNPNLVTDIEPNFYVAAASMQYGTHPGPTVVHAVAAAGRFLSVVNASQTSEVDETVELG